MSPAPRKYAMGKGQTMRLNLTLVLGKLLCALSFRNLESPQRKKPAFWGFMDSFL